MLCKFFLLRIVAASPDEGSILFIPCREYSGKPDPNLHSHEVRIHRLGSSQIKQINLNVTLGKFP